ncbi:hypothetical protein PVAND_010914 [Polypedilum vanderplanki]|uniref:Uncharacterized protein n=1 Tax=Polypedilum vanderplanki TaxID=319348 RepID=A0A9J6CGZ7_POLVA|nr:hypothetical protein PVAND_010914 [Polypedilum vanderplanki]
MKIFTELILSFFVHVVLARAKSEPKNSFSITLGECFYDYDSYKCPEKFLKVPQTTDDDNRWCCIKFEDNQENDPYGSVVINGNQLTLATVDRKNLENINEDNFAVVSVEENNEPRNLNNDGTTQVSDENSTPLPIFNPFFTSKNLFDKNVNDTSEIASNDAQIDENVEPKSDVDESNDDDDASVTESMSIPSTTIEESQITTTTTTVTTKTTQTRRRPKKVNINSSSLGAKKTVKDNFFKRKSFPRSGSKFSNKISTPSTVTSTVVPDIDNDSDGSRNAEHVVSNSAKNYNSDTNNVKDNFIVRKSKGFITDAKDIRDKFSNKKGKNSNTPDNDSSSSSANLPNKQQISNDNGDSLSDNINTANQINNDNSKKLNNVNENATQNQTLSNEIVTQLNDTSKRLNEPLSNNVNIRNLDEANDGSGESLNSVGNNLNLSNQKQQQLIGKDNNESSINKNPSALENQNYANELKSNDTGKLPPSNLANEYNPQEYRNNAEAVAESIATMSKNEIKSSSRLESLGQQKFGGTKQYSENEAANDLLDDSLNSKNPDIDTNEVENGSLVHKNEHKNILNNKQNNDNDNLGPSSLNSNNGVLVV